MELDARSLLLGAGLAVMIVCTGFALGAGDAHRKCQDAYVTAGTSVCAPYETLRAAAFLFVGLGAVSVLVPVVAAVRDGDRGGGLRVSWKR